MDNNVKKVKGSIFVRQKNTIIAFAIIFAVLLGAYIFIIRPLFSDDDSNTQVSLPLIWENEVSSVSGVMMFEHIERASVSEINVHNPSLISKNGEQYVDWSIYRAAENSTVGGYQINKNALYLKGYEYAPFNENDTSSMLASVINDAGFTLAISRVVDHAKDLSKYGLDFENEADATYCEIVTLDGKSYKFYIGDKIPSGNAYYVKMAGKDLCLDEKSEFYGQEIENDSVYIYNCSNLLISPTEVISPILTYPLNTSVQAYFDMFTIIEYTGEGEDNFTTKIQLCATQNKNFLTKPISAFAQEAIYYTDVPKGYYSSSAFEDLFESFINGINGISVKELAVLRDGVDEKDNPIKYYGFDDATMDKYFEGGFAYTLAFSWNGIDNIIDISHLTENGTYYVYSAIYNTICEVSADTLSFLEWDQTVFIDKEFFRVSIKNCSKFEIFGKYFELSTDSDYTEKSVDVSFDLNIDSNGKTAVSSEDFIQNGTMSVSERTENFRTLYRLLLFTGLYDPLGDEEVDKIRDGNEPFAVIKITTRAHDISIDDPDSEEGETNTVTVEGMTRTYRFYKYTSGRCLMTTQDEKGEEVGNYYLMTAKVEQLLRSADKVVNDELISIMDRE